MKNRLKTLRTFDFMAPETRAEVEDINAQIKNLTALEEQATGLQAEVTDANRKPYGWDVGNKKVKAMRKAFYELAVLEYQLRERAGTLQNTVDAEARKARAEAQVELERTQQRGKDLLIAEGFSDYEATQRAIQLPRVQKAAMRVRTLQEKCEIVPRLHGLSNADEMRDLTRLTNELLTK